MSFLLTPDQEDLRDGIRNVCGGRFPMSRVREGFDREVWKELAEAGVFTLRDLGLGTAEATVVFEELGRALVPGPLVWGWLNGRDDVVAGGAEAGATAVEHLDALDVVFVVEDEAVIAVDPRAVQAAAMDRPLDPLSPVHVVESWPSGERHPAEAEGWRRAGAVLVAAQLVGVAAAATELAVAYAKERHQFDRPIGSFQAVKHLLADMLVCTEVARAAVHAAAVLLDDAADGVARAVSAAKVLAGEAAIANGKTCVQVHGGMGFTWEVDAHLYLKRAWVLDKSFGSGELHAAAVADGL